MRRPRKADYMRSEEEKSPESANFHGRKARFNEIRFFQIEQVREGENGQD
jgi:hypothetical protein